VRVVLFQPDQAANFGACIRLCACLGAQLHFIEPTGFPLSDRTLKRVALDYGPACTLVRHDSWDAFAAGRCAAGGALLAVETGTATRYTAYGFAPDSWLLLGRETEGLPPDVLAACDAQMAIPMVAGARSLNMVTAAAMVLGEALRQTGGFAAPLALAGTAAETARQTGVAP
jgi:tRNA (cytidine/uridine-2'-O-)-methyltransferase